MKKPASPSSPGLRVLCLLLPAVLLGCLEDVTSQQPAVPGGTCKITADCKDARVSICDPAVYMCRACRGPEDDARCRDRDPATPRCAEGGVCAACREVGQSQDCANLDPKRPTCGGGACLACSKAADCTSQICLADGSCADAKDVVHVDNKAGMCNTGVAHAGTQQDPACDIQAGVDRARTDRKPYVRVVGSATPYAPITINATSMADLIIAGAPSGDSGALIRGDAAAVTVLGAATRVVVTLQGLDLSSKSSEGVVCDQKTGTAVPELTIRQSAIGNAEKVGLLSVKCKLKLDGVRVFYNNQGGLKLQSSAYDITNVMVYGNSRAPAVTIADAQAGSALRYSTIALNSYRGLVSGVDCGGQGYAVEDSIVVSNDGSPTQFRGCALRNVVTGAEMVAGGVAKAPDFASAQEPLDVHLKSSALSRDCCIDKVQAAPGLPASDVDGRKRPQGAAWDIGAHEVAQ